MPDRGRRPEDFESRLSYLEAWADGIDRWRDDKTEIDAGRHQENKDALDKIQGQLKERDSITDGHDKRRMEKLEGIEAQLRTIALQTAREDGSREQRGKIFGGFGQVLLAAISGGALIELGRCWGIIAKWWRGIS